MVIAGSDLNMIPYKMIYCLPGRSSRSHDGGAREGGGHARAGGRTRRHRHRRHRAARAPARYAHTRLENIINKQGLASYMKS